MIVHTAHTRTNENILLKISLVKSHSVMHKLLLDVPAAIINYFFTIYGTARS